MDSIKDLRGRIEAKTRAARNLLAEMGTHPNKAQTALYDLVLDDAERTKELLDSLTGGGAPSLKAWNNQREALDRFIRMPANEMRTPGVFNTMGTVAGTQGGYTVDPLVAGEVISKLAGYGWVRQVASQVTTSSGAAMSYPTSDGTTEVGERLGENVTASALDPSFGTAPLLTSKYGSKVIQVPFELLQDSSVDVIEFVMQRGIDRIGRLQNVDFTVGTGSNQPMGLLTAAQVGVTAATGGTTTITFDNLADMVDSVDEAALGMPSKQAGVPARQGTGWMFSQTMRRAIRKIKDSNNRPIWVPGIGSELPQLLDYPVFINNDIPSPVANAKTLLFGALSRYMVRDAAQVTLHRFDDSAFAGKGCIGFLLITRAAGNLLDTGAVRSFQQSAT